MFGSGPVWYRMIKDTGHCRDWFWTNLVYVNNLDPDLLVMPRNAALPGMPLNKNALGKGAGTRTQQSVDGSLGKGVDARSGAGSMASFSAPDDL